MTYSAKYWTYNEMWEQLRAWERDYPNLISVEVIGQSRNQLDMPAVTLTDKATGLSGDKAAVLVDANVHAGEVTGNAAAMYWIGWLLEEFGTRLDASELLRHHTVYVVPRIALDGAEVYMSTPFRHRSSPHPYPFTEVPDGFVQDDVNGDGHILHMRVPAADGAFAINEEDPQVMRPRRPDEFDGAFYHVFPEGRIHSRSQSGQLPSWTKSAASRAFNMDFNRNFPIRWAGESGQRGAGPYPLSEPELRAFADFIGAHPNISAYAALHTSGGVILRQPSTGDDTVLSQTDRALFSRVAEMGARTSGYHAGSNYEIFSTGHEKVLMPGAADDWMYDHLGILGFTVELWDIDKRAGAKGYGEVGMRALMKMTPEEETADLRKIYKWVRDEVKENGVFEWQPFDHPDFGRVEIGGIEPKFVLQNPPLHLLADECRSVSAFLTGLGLSTARLTIPSVSVHKEEANVYRIVAEVANAGFLPTSSTEKGRDLTLEGLWATLEGDFTFVSGQSPHPLPHLDGYGSQSTWAPPKGQRAHVEWVVRTASPCQAIVAFYGPRCGRATVTVTLE